MSSVLKALKRLEHEKNVKNKSLPKIDEEILRGIEHQTTRKPFLYVIAGFLLVVISSAGTYLYIKQPAPKTIIENNSDTTTPSPKTDAESKLSSKAPRQSEPLPQTPVPKNVPASPSKTVLPAPIEIKGVSTSPSQINHTPPGTSTPSESKTAKSAAPPRKRTYFSVQGIAHNESGDSIAVINGNTVSVGSKIDGAVVDEIGKDRVRLIAGGEKIEIHLQSVSE